MTFHCSNKLFKWSQKVCEFSAFSLKFQKFFLITSTIFFTVGQNNFGNKIQFLLYRVVKTQSRENLIIFSIRNTLQKFATQTQHDTFHFFSSILNSFIIYYHPEYTKLWQKKMVIFSIRNTVYMNFTLGGCKIP